MSSQSITPATILQQTANSIMRLEEEMKRTQSVVDNWSKKQVEDTQLINHEHKNLMQSYKKTIQELSQEYDRLEKQVREMEQRVKEEHRMESQLRKQVRDAQEIESKIPEQTTTLEQELQQRRHLNKQHEMNIEKIMHQCRIDSERLNFNLYHFEHYLGLKIDRLGDQSKWIRISFTQIDSDNPNQIYSFCVRVEKDSYMIKDCVPEVAYMNILEELNHHNDFRRFVIQMRVLFYQYAKSR